jgi:diguanylate cyclase (GGDEF)-like protein/PAS domain S-box-containing protein
VLPRRDDHATPDAGLATRGSAMTEERRVTLTSYAAVVLVALLGVGIVSAGATYVHNRDVAASRTQFHESATTISSELTDVMLRYGDVLSGSGALFHQGVVSRSQYDAYLSAVGFGSARFRELQGIGFIQRTTPSQVPKLLASLRSDGHDLRTIEPPGRRAEYCLGSYVDPNQLPYGIPLYGYDFCSFKVVANLLRAATETGQQQVFSGLGLPGKYHSLLVLVQPVFRGAPTSVSQRQHQVIGWMLGVINGPDLTAQIRHPGSIQFSLYAGMSAGAKASPVLTTLGGPTAVTWSITDEVNAYGPWTIGFRPTPGLSTGAAAENGPMWLWIFGLVADALLVALLWSLLTARRRADQAVERATELLQSSEERFRSLAGSAPIGIIEVTPSQGVVYANEKMAQISGKDTASLLGAGWLDSVHPDDVAQLVAVIEEVRENQASFEMGFRVVQAGGGLRHVRVMASPRADNSDGAYVVSIEDVTDEVVSREELTYRAFHDMLTGLPNRALFLDRLNLELARHHRDGSKFAVLFLDLDEFKVVNDSLGHESGDEVLKEIGRRLQQSLRKGETAARFSGDEFAFIFQGVSSEEDAIASADRVLALLRPTIRVANNDLIVSGSIGIVIPTTHADATAILRDVDAAMYKAKEEGRSRCAIFDESLRQRSVTRLAIEGDLRRALEEHEFELYYQPAVEPATGAPFAAESLIRWNHPTKGLVPPLDFIPIAEASGLVRPIGRWVFETAAAQLAAWDARDDGPRLAVLSVNVSAPQLDDHDIVDVFADVLERYGVDPVRMCVEVTEALAMSGTSQAHKAIEGFRKLGLRVAIDDFGTGYSSLAYLHTLPVTTIKIDRTFVERLGRSDDATPIVQAIVDMSHAMGLRVVAEGVSDAGLRDAVAALGCDLAQGFFWSKPLPAAAFEEWWHLARSETLDASLLELSTSAAPATA